MKYCKVCGEEIPEGRIKALPEVETCVEHSDVEKEKGLKIVTDEGTYVDLEIANIYRGGIC